MTGARIGIVCALCLLGCRSSLGVSDLGPPAAVDLRPAAAVDLGGPAAVDLGGFAAADLGGPAAADLGGYAPADAAFPPDSGECQVGMDCPTGECTAGYCSVPWPCNNKMKDGQETDVDCGGPAARPCVNGKACVKDDDCWSRKCLGGRCGTKPALAFSLTSQQLADPLLLEDFAWNDLGDLDGDGSPDIAGISDRFSLVQQVPEVVLYHNDGKGNFAKWLKLALPWWGGWIAVRDLDGDGRDDVAVLPLEDPLQQLSEMMVFWNEGNGQFTPAKLDTCFEAWALLVEDLDNDGRPDIAMMCSQDPMTNAIGWSRNAGGRRFDLRPDSSPLVAMTAVTMEASHNGRAPVDLNGDCRPDLVLDGGIPGMAYLLNLGNGRFTPEMFLPLGLTTYFLSSWDFDGDGISDILVADPFCQKSFLVPGVGNGTFGAPDMIAVPPGNADLYGDVAVADFDQDGWVDAAISVGNWATYLNQHGTLSLAAPGARAVPLEPVDLNGDGLPDLVEFSVAGGLSIYLNTSK